MGAEGFGSGVSCRFCVESGKHWTLIAGLEEGQTHAVYINNGESFAVWNHPLDLHYATKSMQVKATVKPATMHERITLLWGSSSPLPPCIVCIPCPWDCAISGVVRSLAKHTGERCPTSPIIPRHRLSMCSMNRRHVHLLNTKSISMCCSSLPFGALPSRRHHPGSAPLIGMATPNSPGVAIGHARTEHPPGLWFSAPAVRSWSLGGLRAMLAPDGDVAGEEKAVP